MPISTSEVHIDLDETKPIMEVKEAFAPESSMALFKKLIF
jgi:hypothetical protein